jgi:YfiH family protein
MQSFDSESSDGAISRRSERPGCPDGGCRSVIRPDMTGCIVPDWPVPDGVRAVATTRRAPGISMAPYDRSNLGIRAGDDVATVTENRRLLTGALSLPSAPVWLHQVHGNEVWRVDMPNTLPRAVADEPAVDATVTTKTNIVLAVLAADCLPVLFAAADGSVIGAAHAGWRGLLGGVLENTVAAMGIAAGSITAWLGPAIGAASYEVGDDVRDAFLAGDRAAAACFAGTRRGHWHCDLYGLARQRLAHAGIAHVHGGGFDTFADAGRFHSFRRDGGRSGRQASMIWIDPART